MKVEVSYADSDPTAGICAQYMVVFSNLILDFSAKYVILSVFIGHHFNLHKTMKRSLSLLGMALLCNMATPAQAAQIWADGVSVTDGWIDYEKVRTQGDGDDNLCWAASSSNIIDFWQQRYVVPAGTPTGEAIWSTFKDATKYDVGGSFLNAMQWWVGGDYQGTTWATSSVGAEDNRCVYKAAATELRYDDNTTEIVYPIYTDMAQFDGYYWETIPETWIGTHYSNTNPRLSHLSNNFLWTNSSGAPLDSQLVNQFSEGMPLSLSLASVGGTLTLAHAVTLWGLDYEEDAEGNITLKKLWLTDSDDYVNALQEINVVYGTNGESIFLTNYTNNTAYGDVYLESASGINISESDTWALAPIPEPTTCTLSLLALAGLAARRRRR